MNRNTYTKRRKQTMSRLKEELHEGKERMKNNQNQKLDRIIERNRNQKDKIDALKRYGFLGQTNLVARG